MGSRRRPERPGQGRQPARNRTQAGRARSGPRPPRRPGWLPRAWWPGSRRWRVALGVAGLLLVAVPVVTDRVLAGVVAGRLADRLACAAALSHRPSVALHGIPVITQVLSGRLREVSVGARDVERNGFVIEQVSAVARDVSIKPGAAPAGAGTPVRIGEITAQATVSYARLAERAARAGRPVEISEDGGLLVVATAIERGGRTVPVTVYAEPRLSAGQLTVEPLEVEVFGLRVPAATLTQRLGTGGLLEQQQLPELPAGLAYTAVRAAEDGLRIELSGSELDTTIGGHGSGKKQCGGKQK